MRVSIFIDFFTVVNPGLSFLSLINQDLPIIFGIAIYSFFNSFWGLVVITLIGTATMLWLRCYYLSEKVIHWVRSPKQERQNEELNRTTPAISPAKKLVHDEEQQIPSITKLHEELERANQDIEIFLYKAYHNFLGPIATIRGVCNVAVLDGQEENASAYFGQVKQVAESMQTMLEKLLQISVIHNHNINIQSVELDSFFEEHQSQQPHFPESIQAYFCTSSLNGITVHTDTFLLTTIIERIVTNAHRFRYPKPRTLTEIFVKYQETPSYDVIYLKEFGLELPNDTLEHLFTMFHRSSAKPDDHGLGFYAARYAARRVGGDVSIESGSGYITFCIQLPRKVNYTVESNIFNQMSE
ncbi:MAG: HAMP domain-containing sensor histidine kinase [Bacteroidota bacterium]